MQENCNEILGGVAGNIFKTLMKFAMSCNAENKFPSFNFFSKSVFRQLVFLDVHGIYYNLADKVFKACMNYAISYWNTFLCFDIFLSSLLIDLGDGLILRMTTRHCTLGSWNLCGKLVVVYIYL